MPLFVEQPDDAKNLSMTVLKAYKAVLTAIRFTGCNKNWVTNIEGVGQIE